MSIIANVILTKKIYEVFSVRMMDERWSVFQQNSKLLKLSNHGFYHLGGGIVRCVSFFFLCLFGSAKLEK
jgi:hypothetical protein